MSDFWTNTPPIDLRDAIDAALRQMKEQNVVRRIWDRDHTVWHPEPTEITNRLGWLDAPRAMRSEIARLNAFREQVMADGITHVLLLGMGGSSLAPELFARIFGAEGRGLTLHVLDSTDPGAVLRYTRMLPPEQTLYIVSSKSGSTVETYSFFKHFYNRALAAVGLERAGQHFIAITDADSSLEKSARQHNFREVFQNDPNIGGRYSALTHFGLVPAALIGVDLDTLLDRAAAMADRCHQDIEVDTGIVQDNPGVWLGAALATLAQMGRDKLTLLPSQSIEPFGDWVEQLIAESLGKSGKGILPVVNEPPGLPDIYGNDRVFVHLHKRPDFAEDAALHLLREAGHPVIRMELADEYDLGGQFVLWEFATAVSGHLLGVQPFDQPNVEAAKQQSRGFLERYAQTGTLDRGAPLKPARTDLDRFLADTQPGDYVVIQAFVEPNDETTKALRNLQNMIRKQTRLAVTFGYGPRYLHSTGQLHKGDAGRGRFIVLTADPPEDVPIPDQPGGDASALTFRVLRDAQALGDKQALEQAGRRVIHFHLGGDTAAWLKALTG